MIKISKLILKGEAAENAASLYNYLPQKLKLYVDKKGKRSDKLLTLGCLLLLSDMLSGTKYTLSDLYYTKEGKPQIDGVYISFSHKGDMCAAVLSDTPVGIDIEHLCKKTYKAAEKFTAAEREYVKKNPYNFFEVWTKKEAASKITGKGIRDIFKIDTISENYNFFTEKSNGYIITACKLVD